MIEDLHTEFKREWDHKCLRSIAGMANADGGIVYIGLSDDGTVCGVDNLQKLLKQIPDTVQNILGITPIVDHHNENNKNFISITVSRSDIPILLEGKLFKKTGSTTREIRHADARNFLVRRYGFIWTEDPCPSVSVSDLDNGYFKDFKRAAVFSGKLTENEASLSSEELMDKLKLIVDGKPKLGAVLLFHPEPERFSRGAYVKIGMFRGSDILYQDRLSGPLFIMPDLILELLTSKYTIIPVEFNDITRVEKLAYPIEALREIILNTIIHSDYGAGVEIQIKVYQDHIVFFNSGAPPDDWTMEYLLGYHRSVPGNPTLAEVFYRAGKIESFGRGIQKVLDQYKDRSARLPKFDFDSSSFSVFLFNENPLPSVQHNINLSEKQVLLINSMSHGSFSVIELMEFVSSKNRESFRKNVLKPLLEGDYISMMSRESPNSPKQRYRLTEKGWSFKEENE